MLCQGLGRAARIAYLLQDPPAASSSDSEEGSTVGQGSGATGGSGSDSCAGARVMPAAEACSEICRRGSDFAGDHPCYLSFVDSLLAAKCGGVKGGDLSPSMATGSGGTGNRSGEWGKGSYGRAAAAAAAALIAGGGGFGAAGATSNIARLEGSLAGNERQRYQWRQWQQWQEGGTTTAASYTSEWETGSDRVASASSAPAISDGAHHGTRTASGAGITDAAAGEGRSAGSDLEKLVMSEKALGAAMAAVAKDSGGREAAALLLPRVGVEPR